MSRAPTRGFGGLLGKIGVQCCRLPHTVSRRNIPYSERARCFLHRISHTEHVLLPMTSLQQRKDNSDRRYFVSKAQLCLLHRDRQPLADSAASNPSHEHAALRTVKGRVVRRARKMADGCGCSFLFGHLNTSYVIISTSLNVLGFDLILVTWKSRQFPSVLLGSVLC